MATPVSPSLNSGTRRTARQIATLGIGGLMALLLLIQLLPFGRNHTNPPVLAEPAWDSPETRALFVRGCADCHSNETVWPWYSNIAPVSWLIARDVEHGREHFNVSEWGRPENEGDEAAEAVREGAMPLAFYLPLHPEARFTPAERERLIAGLAATFGDEDDD